MKSHWTTDMLLPAPSGDVPEGYCVIPTLGALIEAMFLSYKQTHDGREPRGDGDYTSTCEAMAELVVAGFCDAFYNPEKAHVLIGMSDEQLVKGIGALPQMAAEAFAESLSAVGEA